MNNDPDLARALVYLLLQVAWADDDVSDDEIAHVTAFAERAGFPAAERSLLEAFLRGDQALPPPDLGYLREHRDAALVAVGEMMASDDSIVSDEKAIFDQIRELLA